MDFVGLAKAALEFIMKVWGWASGISKRKLESNRRDLEEESRQHQLNGDLDQLRRVRGEIQEIDRKLSTGDY